MSKFVEQCPSCNQPIYLEDNISGACSCAEGGLRQLLARARQGREPIARPMTRVASQKMPQAAPSRQLPELAPEMFLSQGALREVQAATQTIGSRAPQPVDPRRITAEQWRNSRRSEVDLDFSMDSAVEQALTEGPRESEETMTALASIWQRGVEADLGEGFQVDFSPEDIEFERPPIPARGPLPDPRGTRFRVDRPQPEPAPFRREIVDPPMREIGQVRGARILTDRGARPAPPEREAANLNGDRSPSGLQEIRESARRSPALPAREANARSMAQRMAEHMRLPTAYEHLIRSDPFEDADF